MNIKSMGPLAICAAALSGCATTIETADLPFQSKPSPRFVPAGFVYHLPVVEIMPEASLTIAKCKTDDKVLATLTDAADAKVDAPLAEVEFKRGGSVSSEIVGGPRVVIDYRRLAQFLKTGSVDIERYPNGTLKTINASIADETPEAIASAGAAVGSLYLLSIGAPVAAASLAGAAASPVFVGDRTTLFSLGTTNKSLSDRLAQRAGGASGVAKLVQITYPVCTATTKKDLADREIASAKRDADTDTLETRSAELAKLLTEAGTVFSADERTRINSLRAEILTLTASISATDAKMKKLDGKLSLILTTKNRRPPAVAEMTDAALLLTPEPDDDKTAVTRFMNTHFETRTLQVAPSLALQFALRECGDTVKGGPDSHCRNVADIEAYVRKAADVKVKGERLTALSAGGVRADCDPANLQTRIPNTAPSLDPRCGAVAGDRAARGSVVAGESIVYVEPSPYRFRLTAWMPGPAGAGGRRLPLDTKTIDVPQLGTWLGLPLRAGFGEKVELSATFNEAGTLTKASYKRPQSGGKATADMLKSLAATAVDARDKGEARRLKLVAEADARRLALVTGQTAEATARVALLEAQDKERNWAPKTEDADKELKALLATATAQALLEEAYLRIAVAQRAQAPR